MNKRKIIKKKIFFLLLISAILLITGYIGGTILGAEHYLQKKYSKNFYLYEYKLAYFPDVSDFSDFPLLYKPGQKIPTTIIFKDESKEFTVIFNNFKYFDDYQLEEINELATQYFVNLTGNKNIETVLFGYPPYYSDESNLLSSHQCEMLKDVLFLEDNRLWTKNNIDILIFECLDKSFSIFIYDDFSDISSLESKAEKTYNKIYERFGDKNDKYKTIRGSLAFSIFFTNKDIKLERLGSGYGAYYGFNKAQNILCLSVDFDTIQSLSKDNLSGYLIEDTCFYEIKEIN